ncbi:MAG: FliA/WhiG family RNA polymerase sigma factor [Lachnospiraceae bacterium]|nr:FliA/WhiG family RNA polymerase sigma factor [Lachnospiraceae bacterium]MBR4815689.1 FliA/WhiG family RNA polymerase sigma factor [Lachnospiraceae bacterium]
MAADRDKMWSEYSKQKTPQLREKLIIEYSGLVKVVAGKLSMYLGYTVEYDDLVGYGIFGLIDAIDKFDYGKGIKFETYASLRIRGEILDQIRKMDWIPRTVRQKQKQLDMAYRKIEERTGRLATDEEIAEELGITLEELCNMQNETKVSNIISLDEYMEQGDSKVEPVETKEYMQPDRVVEKEELKKLLLEVLETLTEKEKKVILLYYYEEMTLKEISNVMDVSESRVSQLHSKALIKMRQRLGNNMQMFLG